MKAWDEGRLDNRFQAFALKDKLGLILLQKLFYYWAYSITDNLCYARIKVQSLWGVGYEINCRKVKLNEVSAT